MKIWYTMAIMLGIFASALFPARGVAQECPLDVYDTKFLDQVRQLVLANDVPRKDLGSFKDNFGLAKMPFDVLNGVQTGLYNKELKFISTWKDADKVVNINARDINRWQVEIGINGKPPPLIGNIADTMGAIGNGLMAYSLLINAVDAYNGGDTEKRVLAVESYKAAHSIAMAKYATNAMQLAMVGVSFMDYVLNKAMKATLAQYNAYWWDAYKAYLISNYSPQSWAQLYQTKGEAAVEARLREFWADALINAATYNQKNTGTISRDALALASFPDPFAARFRVQVLAPVLRRYYKNHAEDAEFEIEQTLENKCDRLARQMGKLNDLNRLILAAREEMNKQEKDQQNQSSDKPAGEKPAVVLAAEEGAVAGANDGDDWNSFLDSLSEKNKAAGDGADALEKENETADAMPTDNIKTENDLAVDSLEQDNGQAQDQSEWNDLEADYGKDTPIDDATNTDAEVETGDEWDSIDEVDDTLVGANENQINTMRDQMANQVRQDRNRISADARNKYARVEARREEQRRRRAQQRAELAAALQGLADGVNAAYNEASQPTVASSTPTHRYGSSGSASSASSGGGMTNAQYQRLLKRCMDAKYAKARNSGFPIMDPNGPRIQCNAEIRGGMKGNNASSFGNRSVRNTGGGAGNGSGDLCQAIAKGSKNPRRWEACCRKGGEMRYNAFTTPDGSRTGVSAYRCMQKGKPDKPDYMIRGL